MGTGDDEEGQLRRGGDGGDGVMIGMLTNGWSFLQALRSSASLRWRCDDDGRSEGRGKGGSEADAVVGAHLARQMPDMAVL